MLKKKRGGGGESLNMVQILQKVNKSEISLPSLKKKKKM